MELGMIGLGRMGGNMARRVLRGGHRLVAYDPKTETLDALAQEGAVCKSSLTNLIEELSLPRTVWVMVPEGGPTEDIIQSLSVSLSSGDTVIDGGNSNYKDSIRRSALLADRGIFFLDIGTSGGIWGLEGGYSMMVGGDVNAFLTIEPILRTLAPTHDSGYGHVGPAGAGHFVKMVHNGIEYGLMEAYAEGFELLRAKEELHLDMTQIANIWRDGSVVRSWLLDLIAIALQDDPTLEAIQAYVEDSGEGRWTVQESIDLNVPAPVISLSLQARFRSRQDQPFGAKMLAAMRNQFGGHTLRKTGD